MDTMTLIEQHTSFELKNPETTNSTKPTRWYFRSGIEYTNPYKVKNTVKVTGPGCGTVRTLVACHRCDGTGRYGSFRECWGCSGQRGRLVKTVKLYTLEKIAQLNQQAENRAAAKQRKIQADQAAAESRFATQYPNWNAWKDTFKPGSFGHDVMRTIVRKGTASDHQITALNKAYASEQQFQQRQATWAKENKDSQHVGTAGARITVQVKVRATRSYDNEWGGGTWYLLTDPDGNQMVYSGSADLGEKGGLISLTATIKEHMAEKDGTLRTKLSRPKVNA